MQAEWVSSKYSCWGRTWYPLLFHSLLKEDPTLWETSTLKVQEPGEQERSRTQFYISQGHDAGFRKLESDIQRQVGSDGYWGGIRPTTTSICTGGHRLDCQQCAQFYHHPVWEGPVHSPPPTSSMCCTPLELCLHPFLLIASKLWAAANISDHSETQLWNRSAQFQGMLTQCFLRSSWNHAGIQPSHFHPPIRWE